MQGNCDSIMNWYVTLFCITGIIELVAGVLMLSQRRRHRDRSRLLIAIFFLLTAVVVAVTMGLMLSGRYVKGDHILGTGAILTGFALFFLLLLYPLEVLRPNWINPRRLLALISPWLFFTLLLLALLPFGQTELHSPAEILPNIYHSDVLLRVLLSLIFIPYGLWLIFIRYNWRNSSAPKRWINTIVLMAMAMTVTFSLSRTLGMLWISYLHMFLYVVLTAVILWMEFRVRFKVPDNTEEGAFATEEGAFAASLSIAEDKPMAETALTTQELVRDKLTAAMEQPEIWQNPELSRGMLCKILGTNTNYLQKAIKELGYASYSEMINCKRVEFVRREIEAGNKENIQDLFYRAGYRSRVTAWRNFTSITGKSPSSFGLSEPSE